MAPSLQDLRVAVVDGSIGGLAAAVALNRLGASVQVFEKGRRADTIAARKAAVFVRWWRGSWVGSATVRPSLIRWSEFK